MLKSFPGGRELEVVVSLSPSENEKQDLFEKVMQKMEEAGVVPM